jgi:hypothetical protein
LGLAQLAGCIHSLVQQEVGREIQVFLETLDKLPMENKPSLSPD